MAGLDSLSRQELLQVLQLLLSNTPTGEAIVSRYLEDKESKVSAEPPKKKKKPCREFDMSKYRERHIAIHLQYNGTEYYGFASQAEGICEETVEKHLFLALCKLRLVSDRRSCNYNRCGRTDKGVSAFGQVISLNVRSSFPKDLTLTLTLTPNLTQFNPKLPQLNPKMYPKSYL
jgi:hypothetical protein